MSEPDYAAEMKLPAGKICDDCRHAEAGCFKMGFTTPGRTSCDFWPNHYREKVNAQDAV